MHASCMIVSQRGGGTGSSGVFACSESGALYNNTSLIDADHDHFNLALLFRRHDVFHVRQSINQYVICNVIGCCWQFFLKHVSISTVVNKNGMSLLCLS